MSTDRAFDPKRLGSPKRILAELQHDVFYRLLHRPTSGLVELGEATLGCNWTICSKNLGPNSVIYSAGVGRDITFEHALADRFGAKVILLDPSPTGLETMNLAENQREQFVFLNAALAGHDGELELAPPPDPEEGSWILGGSDGKTNGPDAIRVGCRSITSLVGEFRHSHVDLLKIDIEGAEYSVLESIMKSPVKIKQIAVEFHNGVLPGIPRSRTIRSLISMFRKGYRIVHKGGSNHTLMLVEEI